MKATKMQELEDMAAKLLATARKLSSGARTSRHPSEYGEISFADSYSATCRRFTAGTPRAEGEGKMNR
jgi:hypothetical protein